MRKRNALVATVVVLMFTPGVRADLFCAEPVVTLGQVKAGRPLSYRFTFTNRSPNDLQITNVEPSCGCLKPRIGQKRLQPGKPASSSWRSIHSPPRRDRTPGEFR